MTTGGTSTLVPLLVIAALSFVVILGVRALMGRPLLPQQSAAARWGFVALAVACVGTGLYFLSTAP